jgi:hypothetical protein
MADLALWAIRVLRALPHTARFDKHLTDCAALAVVYEPFGETLVRLRLAHVLRIAPLPVMNCDELRCGLKPQFDYARFFLRRGLNALH